MHPGSHSPLRVGMRRILIVDDNSAVRDVVRTILSRAGYAATVAENGHAALSILAQQEFDLALVDIEMPDLTGYDVCTYIKTHRTWRNIPVILMTGRPLSGVPESVKAVGASALVAKPFERHTLLQCLKAFLPSDGEVKTEPVVNLPK